MNEPSMQHPNGTGWTLQPMDILAHLRRRGKLLPIVHEAILEKIVVAEAEAAGWRISNDELQQAADDFRHRRGLTSAAKTSAWLKSQGITLDDFENSLELDLLVTMLKDSLAKGRMERHFDSHRERYDRAVLRQIVVATESIAQELRTQVMIEGKDFADLAREHSLHEPSRRLGGSLGVVIRCELPREIGEAVFTASPNDIVGPVASGQGFHLFLVEAIAAPTLDHPTSALVREEIFAAWKLERIQNVRLGSVGLRST